MSLEIKCYPKGIFGENTYLITDEATGEKAVIDPGYYAEEVLNDIQDGSCLKYLLLTHGHNDHFSAAGKYLEEYSKVTFAAPEKEKYLIEKGRCPSPSLWLKEGDIITLGETELKVIETPGHSEGGICFVTGSEVFTGDTLFRLSVGRTDFETGSWDQLMDSIRQKLYTLDDDLVVYSGHGSPTTIGYEKKANPFV